MDIEQATWMIKHQNVIEAIREAGGDVDRFWRMYKLAQQLMAEPPDITGWTLKIGTAQDEAGSYRYKYRPGTYKWDGQPGRLMLSAPLMSLREEEETRKTILHEKAHCLAPEAIHGPAWQDWCYRLGIEPERLYGENEPPPIPYPWTGHCAGRHPHGRRQPPEPGGLYYCTLCKPRAPITWRKNPRGRNKV